MTFANQLLKHDFITINNLSTAEQAIDTIRNSPNKNKRPLLYVIDDDNCLLGVLNINTLLVSNFGSHVSEIMEDDYDFISEDILQKKGLIDIFTTSMMLELPVLNKDKQILGIVDVHMLLNKSYNNKKNISNVGHKAGYVPSLISNVKNSSTFILYKSRTPWLVILIFMNIFSGAGIAAFEDVIASSIALVFFLPLLIDSAGNAGSQSATLVVRSFALGDVKMKDWFSLFSKETLVSFTIAITMTLAVVPLGIWRGGYDIAIIVGLTMFSLVILGCLIGISLPFIFQLLKLDPAIASGPLITSIADITGILVYFSIASLVLGI